MARHVDVPDTYVMPEWKDLLGIYVQVPKNIVMDAKQLKSLGVDNSSRLALFWRSLSMAEASRTNMEQE